MTRIRRIVLARIFPMFFVVAVVVTLSPRIHARGAGEFNLLALQTRIEDFRQDPAKPQIRRFTVTGPGAAQFAHDADSAPRFLFDPPGSLAVTYDSVEPTSRYATRFPIGFTHRDDFVLGAILTIRAEGFEPDPSGFHPIAFQLFNAATTGDDRTGSLSDFRADTWDTVEFSYFPNVSPFFRGPFLAPDVFGEQVGTDAFANFAFASVPFALEPGITYLVEMEHSAAARTLTTRVSMIHPLGRAVPVAGGSVVVALQGLTGFRVDSLGIVTYHDGFNIFAESGRSLLATVDFDLIYSAPRIEGRIPGRLEALLGRLRGGRNLSTVDAGGQGDKGGMDRPGVPRP